MLPMSQMRLTYYTTSTQVILGSRDQDHMVKHVALQMLVSRKKIVLQMSHRAIDWITKPHRSVVA